MNTTNNTTIPELNASNISQYYPDLLEPTTFDDVVAIEKDHLLAIIKMIDQYEYNTAVEFIELLVNKYGGWQENGPFVTKSEFLNKCNRSGWYGMACADTLFSCGEQYAIVGQNGFDSMVKISYSCLDGDKLRNATCSAIHAIMANLNEFCE